MTGKQLYLGVDGGGTKTEFVCIDAAGQERARSRTGATYHLEVGFEEVIERLRNGVGEVAEMVGIASDAFAFVFFGLPAFGEDQSIDPRLQAACGRILNNPRYACGNDMVCAWAGSLAGEDGINIVAGTGSIGYGERGGRTARAGGWGEVFSDEGSAHWIALEGLAAFSRMSDGRLPRGPLHARLRAALTLEEDVDLCQRIMGPPKMTRSDVAALAPIVSAAANEGDRTALDILERGATHLAEIALAIRRTLGFPDDEQVPISWSGSILSEAATVRHHFLALLEATNGFRFVDPIHPPGYGAALFAKRLAARAR